MSHRVSSELLTYLHVKYCVNIRSPKGDTRWCTAAEIMNKKIKKATFQTGKDRTDWPQVYMRETMFPLS